MLNCMIEVRNQTLPSTERQHPNVEQMINEILNNGKVVLSIEDYLVWTAKNKDLPGEFAKLIYQLSHVVLGLRPPHRQAEGEILRGWLDREEKAEMNPGQIWYLLNMDWWNSWQAYVNFVPKSKANNEIVQHNQFDSMTENQTMVIFRWWWMGLANSEESTLSHQPVF